VGRVSSLTADAQVESSLPGPSVATFTQLVGEATYKATAFRTHTLNVYLRGVTPFGSDAPPQRYEILGGPSTLPTLAVAHYRGDHLAFADARYGIPLPVAVPFVGQPSLQFIYLAGAAWKGPNMPRWTQNPGLGLAFTLASVEAVIDPAASGFKPRLVFAASIPRF
jgi:hypothetical protein